MNFKRALALAIFCMGVSSTNIFAQMGGYMGMGGMGMSRADWSRMSSMHHGQSHEEITGENLVTSTGLFIIDFVEVIDKCKIKDKAVKDRVRAVFSLYRKDYDEIYYEYKPQVDSIAATNVEQLMKSPNSQSTISKIRSTVFKITKKTTPLHKELNEKLTALLNEKELHRWDVYYRNLCSKNMYIREEDRPTRPEGEKPKEADTKTK